MTPKYPLIEPLWSLTLGIQGVIEGYGGAGRCLIFNRSCLSEFCSPRGPRARIESYFTNMSHAPTEGSQVSPYYDLAFGGVVFSDLGCQLLV